MDSESGFYVDKKWWWVKWKGRVCENCSVYLETKICTHESVHTANTNKHWTLKDLNLYLKLRSAIALKGNKSQAGMFDVLMETNEMEEGVNSKLSQHIKLITK